LEYVVLVLFLIVVWFSLFKAWRRRKLLPRPWRSGRLDTVLRGDFDLLGADEPPS
jgi:hypothetical protein